MKCKIVFIFALFFFVPGFGNEVTVPKEETVETSHHINLNGVEIKYMATAGTLHLTDDKGAPKASMFYISYIKETHDKEPPRPLTFCFNGGPGAAAIWLHLGMLGPKRVEFQDNPQFNAPPYRLIDNPFSFLDMTDLVFIDPVSTGYSKAAPGEDPKQFYGVEEDIKSVAEFIRLFTTRRARWDSPKFLIGESYGTTRAVGLASYLFDEYKFYLNGIVLISSILDFQTVDFDENNSLSYLLYLPSYTAAAWYHQKLDPELQKDLQETLKKSEAFALNDYALALLKGDSLEKQKYDDVATQLARFTGFSVQDVKNHNLQINMRRFTSELLKDKRATMGRFDSRFLGYASDGCGETFNYDPSATAVFGAFTAGFMDYVRKDLKWEKDDPYQVLANLKPWNYGVATNSYLNVTDHLREAMVKNPSLKIYVASGLFDLATPYFGSVYTFNHLKLNPILKKNITMGFFEAGHMMYIHLSSLEKLKQELLQFYRTNQASK